MPEEVAKRAKHPFDMWDEIAANAAAARFPKGLDIFRHKFHGLFYVAPNQDAFMLRLRLPGGIVLAHQARGLADVAERWGGGYVDITTRANLQIREIGAAHPIDVLTAIDELGLTSRGAGADNIRNLTGSPAAGIDPRELYDTRPLCRALYHLILNHRELYGLPRKFNIAFDGGGQALAVRRGHQRYRLCRGAGGAGQGCAGGHPFPDAARRADRAPELRRRCRRTADAERGHSGRGRDPQGGSSRMQATTPTAHKARMEIPDRPLGHRKALVTEAAAYAALRRGATPTPEVNEPRGPIDRDGHIGVHDQAQPGLCYIGVVAAGRPADRRAAARALPTSPAATARARCG